MEVTPEHSARSRSPPSDGENLSEDLNQEGSIAAHRPRRKRSPVTYGDDEEESGRSARRKRSEEEEEEDSKPAAVARFPVGMKIRKSFEGEDYDGKVDSGPKTVKGERVWHVVYEDGDEEDLNWKELMPCVMEDQAFDGEAAFDQAPATMDIRAPGRGRRGKKAEPAYTMYRQDYQTAFTDLKWRIGTTEEEVKAALAQMKPPYGLNEAMQRIHEARKEPGSFVPREKFFVQKGMRIRKAYAGALWYGTVMTDDPEWCDDPETGDKVKMWEVQFDDGMSEDMDFDELRVCYAGRPIRSHPARGRQLCALELFCGVGIVSQEFAERKWAVRSIDIDPNSYATDVVDIMKLKYKDIGMVPDFIWASIPCHTYSNMAGGVHRSAEPGKFEKSEEARKNNRFLAQLVSIMRWAKSKNPNLIVAIENPVGLLRKMPLMKEIDSMFDLKRASVNYCAFGRDDKKPTYIWTNSFDLYKFLDDYKCNEKCPYYGGVHPVGVRANGHQFNAAAIPDALAAEVAHNVDATCYFRRFMHNKEVTLTKEEEEEFNDLMVK